MRTVEPNGFLYPETGRLYEELASYEPVNRPRKRPYWHMAECHALALLLALAEAEHGGSATEEVLEGQLYKEVQEVLESAERLLKGNGAHIHLEWFGGNISALRSAMVGIRARLKKMREEEAVKEFGLEKEPALA